MSVSSLEDEGLDAVLELRYLKTWRSDVVVITTAQLQPTKPELRFSTGSNPVHRVSDIRDGEDL